jgi:DNA polymerase-1
MVIAAAMSGDEALNEVLSEVCPTPDKKGDCVHDPKHGDPHGQFQQAVIDLTGIDPGRTVAKNWNYGANYGAGPATQQRTLAKVRSFIDFETATLLDAAHRDKYAGYHEYNTEMQELAMARGYSETEFGRRRYDSDLKSPDFETRSAAARAAGNMPIQGTAADIVKKAMADVVPILQEFGAHMSLTVHDELDGWVHADVAEEFDKAMKMQLGSYVIRGMRLQIGGGIGDTWEEVH